MRKSLILKIGFLFVCGVGISAQAKSASMTCDSLIVQSNHCICDSYRIESGSQLKELPILMWKNACKYVREKKGNLANFEVDYQKFVLTSIDPKSIDGYSGSANDKVVDVIIGNKNNAGTNSQESQQGSCPAEAIQDTTSEAYKRCSGNIASANAMGQSMISATQVMNSGSFSENSRAAVGKDVEIVKTVSGEEVLSISDFTNLVNKSSSLEEKEKEKIIGEYSKAKTDKQKQKISKNLQDRNKKVVKNKLEAERAGEIQQSGTGLALVESEEEQAKLITQADNSNYSEKEMNEFLANLDNEDRAVGDYNSGYLANHPKFRPEAMSKVLNSREDCSGLTESFNLLNSISGQDTAEALNLNFNSNYPENNRYSVSTCNRYTQNDYFQTGGASLGSKEHFKAKNICADIAKGKGDIIQSENTTACSIISHQMLSCSSPESKAVSCPRAQLDTLVRRAQGQSPQLTLMQVYTQNSENFIKKIVEANPAYLNTNQELENYLKGYDPSNPEECNVECSKYYKSEIKIGKITGFNGCLKESKVADVLELIHHCVAYKEVAKMHFDENGNFESRNGDDNRFESFDSKFRCARSTPFAADYSACKRLVTTYNAAFVGEQALGMSEGVQRSIREANSYEKLAEAQAGGGDIQTLGLNVVKDSAKTNEVLATQRAAFYTTQTAVLGGFLAVYPSKGNLKSRCEEKVVAGQRLDGQLCNDAIHLAEKSGSTDQMFFPNKGTRNQFWAELIQAAGKSAVAWIQKGQYKKQQNILEEVKNSVAETDDTGFDLDPTYCQRYPNSNECRGSGIRQNVDGFYGGGINVGSVGNNDYAFGSDGVGEYNEGRELPSASTINDITSMLGEGGEKGSNDFNKVAAAELTRGASGGGGGGGPAGGGGAAGLSGGSGSGAQGDAQGTGDVGITKSNGKYAGTGGTAYTAGTARRLGQDQKVDNPFSSLFGAKNSARDVASQVEDDIAPAKIGLFETISNRYTKVNNDKRLLDSNVK